MNRRRPLQLPLGRTARVVASRFLVDYRLEVGHIAIPNRRLAVYRRCALKAAENTASLERRLKRAKASSRKQRWASAIAFWKELGDYFSHAIRVNCGEQF